MRRQALVFAVMLVGAGCAGPTTVGGEPGAGGDPSSKGPTQNGTANGGTSGGGGGSGAGTGTGTGSGSGAGRGSGTGTGSGSGIAVDGTYDLTTQFNLLDALPPDVKDAISMSLAFADSPGEFLLDQAGRLPVIKYVVDAIKLFSGVHDMVVKGIDEYINRWSGGLLTEMHDLAQDIEMALRGLKAHNQIVLAAPDASGNASVQDTLVDLTFTYKGKDYPYAQNAHANAAAQLKGLQLLIAHHTYDHGLNIGGLLVDLIDNVALPQLTGVDSLGAFLNQLVNCDGVGDWVWSYIGNICLTTDQSTCVYKYINAYDIAKLCRTTLDAAGKAIEDRIAALDAPGMMSVSDGSSLLLEQQGPVGHADTLMGGQWSLTLPIGIGNITLPGAFTGSVEGGAAAPAGTGP